MLSAERDENTERKPFTPTEMVAIGRLIEERERPTAAERRRFKSRAADMTVGGDHVGRASGTAAKALGIGENKYVFARAVVRAAEADPEQFGDLPEQMDASGEVAPAYRELKRRQKPPEKITEKDHLNNYLMRASTAKELAYYSGLFLPL